MEEESNFNNAGIRSAMPPFQEIIQSWLSRKYDPRSTNECAELPFILSTDIGLVRKENQDRVAAIHTGKKSINPIFAIAVADGMGGMRNGGDCSTLAISSFFHSLIQHRNLNLYQRARAAIEEANSQIFKIYQGAGGSTLTAVIVDSHGAQIFSHVGDTRIYTFSHNSLAKRHTTDDSLAEAVGGSGRELLQFVGMGESMLPKISDLPITSESCAITTDGIHSIEEKTLYKILANCSDIKCAAERLSDLSRWCGGHDNATSAIFKPQEILSAILKFESAGIRVWDASGELTTIWLRDEDQASNAKHFNINPKQQPLNKPEVKQETKAKKGRASTKRTKKKKESNDHYQGNIELDIEFGGADEHGKADDNSK